jgi:energy-coupling factor transport system permease protein
MACAVVFDNPLVLGALLVALVLAARSARSGEELRRVLPYVGGLALTAAVLNPLFSHQGLTVIARLGRLPGFGEIDVTLEAVIFGAVAALKLLVFTLGLALMGAAVDPDELLRMARRVSFRSALTASLATRMWAVLERDARRLAEAQRCRFDAPDPAGRSGRVRLSRGISLVRAVATGALDRAVDVAATLELRGYAGARRPPSRPRSWSRQDVAFAAGAVALIALAVAARSAGVGGFDPYPTVRLEAGVGELGLGVALVVVALLPFTQRRGVYREALAR